MKKHKCQFTALYAAMGLFAPRPQHAHQCLTCFDVLLVGEGHECDRDPKTHWRDDAVKETP